MDTAGMTMPTRASSSRDRDGRVCLREAPHAPQALQAKGESPLFLKPLLSLQCWARRSPLLALLLPVLLPPEEVSYSMHWDLPFGAAGGHTGLRLSQGSRGPLRRGEKLLRGQGHIRVSAQHRPSARAVWLSGWTGKVLLHRSLACPFLLYF